MEHIVDCVLYFEGDRHSSYRLLRCVKNRFGSTNEIGVFEMGEKGLVEVENPSMLLLSGRPLNVSGACVACTIEGTRPMLAEVQGLVSPTGFGNPRRMATGFDYNRLALILAVLEKRAGYFFSNLDTYVNVVGGLWLDEPAVDLPVALSLISGLKDVAIPSDCLAFGEIGLTGELRAVSNADLRVQEAVRMGFTRIVLPQHNVPSVTPRQGVKLLGAKTVREAFEMILG
jgi:DNA repair protein RadA/Sms